MGTGIDLCRRWRRDLLVGVGDDVEAEVAGEEEPVEELDLPVRQLLHRPRRHQTGHRRALLLLPIPLFNQDFGTSQAGFYKAAKVLLAIRADGEGREGAQEEVALVGLEGGGEEGEGDLRCVRVPPQLPCQAPTLLFCHLCTNPKYSYPPILM